MLASYCSMSVAVGQIQGEDPLLCSARDHLAVAVDCAGRYHKTENSIYWKDAKPALKRSVRAALNTLAYDTYSAFVDAAQCLNQYGDLHRETVLPPAWWNDVIVNLTLAYDAIVREHPHEIDSKQLALF